MTDSPGLRDRAFVGLQHLLPQHLLSRGMRELTRVELAPVTPYSTSAGRPV